MAKSWSYKLDPRHYQGLYIHKVYQESFSTGVSTLPQPPSPARPNFSSTSVIDSASSSQGSTSGGPAALAAASEMYSAQSMLDNDIVGLTVIEASPQYIMKFNTLRQHLYIQEHPIVKILNLFRDCLLQFLKESEESIKQLLTFYDNKPLSNEERNKQEQ